eukprot:Skav213295  [mRNA]  locus=scaffold2480:352990:357637:+ [translate_table: standard]
MLLRPRGIALSSLSYGNLLRMCHYDEESMILDWVNLRSARRNRARARLRWWLHRTGRVVLSSEALRSIRQTLSQHHSRDLQYLRRIRKAEIAMEYNQEGSWRCKKCRQLRTATAKFCQDCGTPWQKSIDYSYNPPAQQREWSQPRQWTEWEGDEWWHQTPKKPNRRPTPSPKRNGKGNGKGKNGGNPQPVKGKGKGKGKSKEKEKNKGKGKGKEEPPWQGVASSSGVNPNAQPNLPPSPAEQQLKSLVNQLRKEGNMSTEVQQIVQESNRQQAQDATKAMHNAVNRLGQARKQLQTAAEDRAGLHSAWTSYIAAGIGRWKTFANEFQEQDAKLKEAIKIASENFQQARTDLVSIQESTLQEEKLKADVTLLEDEDMVENSSDLSSQINDGVKNMIQNLEAMKETADVALAETQARVRKRQKIAGEDGPGTEESGTGGPGLVKPLAVTSGHADLGLPDIEPEWSGYDVRKHVEGGVHHFGATSNARHKSDESKSKKRVSFAEHTEVFLGADGLQHLHRIVVPDNAPQTWTAKPWVHFQDEAGDSFDDTSFLAHLPQNLHPEHPLRHPDLPAGEEADDLMNDIFDDEIDEEVPMEHETEEESAELSSSPETSIDSQGHRHWQTILLLRLGSTFDTMRVRWDDYETMVRDIGSVTSIPWRQIVHIHAVTHPPRDLEDSNTYPVILQRVGDLRPGEPLQFVMIDVVFFNSVPAHQSEVVRMVKLLPLQVTRALILRFLHLEAYCARVHNRCLFWCNHKLIKLQSPAAFNVQHGDYIRIALPPMMNDCEVPARDLANMAFRRVPLRSLRAQWGRLDHRAARDHMPPYTTRLEHTGEGLDVSSFLNLLQTETMLLKTCVDYMPVTRSPRQHGVDLPSRFPPEHEEWDPSTVPLNASGPVDGSSEEEEPPHPLQALFDAWEADVGVRPEDEEQAADFNTYYLHGERFQQCPFPRKVTLVADPLAWLTAISRAWADHLDPLEDRHYVFVKPEPPSSEAVAGHIILIERQQSRA